MLFLLAAILLHKKSLTNNVQNRDAGNKPIHRLSQDCNYCFVTSRNIICFALPTITSDAFQTQLCMHTWLTKLLM